MAQNYRLTQQVCEIRYERGYRYLDRCGEAMLVLEEVLPNDTAKIWMPEDIAPTGAKLKCPELDMHVAFDAYHLIVDQNPADVDVDFFNLCSTIYAVISARFDLRNTLRLGYRRFLLVPSDSLDDAESLSLKHSPIQDWPVAADDRFRPKAVEATTIFENSDCTEGFRFSVKPAARIDAPQQIDQRLRLRSHLLPQQQRDALLDQQRRRIQRERDPMAGIVVDIDCYQLRPAKADVFTFLKDAMATIDRLLEAYIKGK